MSNSWPCLNPMDVFFAQEILDFYKRTILLKSDVDREVSIYGPHLAMEVQCNI